MTLTYQLLGHLSIFKLDIKHTLLKSLSKSMGLKILITTLLQRHI